MLLSSPAGGNEKREAGASLFQRSFGAGDRRLDVVNLRLVNLDEAAADMAAAVTVEEVEDEADDRPDREQGLRFDVQAEEEQQAAEDRERCHDEQQRRAERTH